MTKRTLVVGIGNPLRGDDGAAWRLLERIPGQWECDRALQLTPEWAERLIEYERVVFADAAAGCAEPKLEPASDPAATPIFTHTLQPPELVALSRLIFGFRGEAWICHLPAYSFEGNETLSGEAAAAVERAARLLTERLLT